MVNPRLYLWTCVLVDCDLRLRGALKVAEALSCGAKLVRPV